MTRRAALLCLVVAGSALALVWRFQPGVAPPLYDGCITEPYRYLGSSPSPSSATHDFPGGSFEPSEVVTDDSPAQGQVLMDSGTFASTQPFTVTVAPVQPPRPAPPGARFDGNVYRIVATTSGGSQLQPQPGVVITVVLRGTSSTGPARTMVRLDGQTWSRLATVMAGCGDEYEATSSKLGVFAIVQPAGGGGSSGGSFPTTPVVIVLLVLAVVAPAVVLLRMNRGARR